MKDGVSSKLRGKMSTGSDQDLEENLAFLVQLIDLFSMLQRRPMSGTTRRGVQSTSTGTVVENT